MVGLLGLALEDLFWEGVSGALGAGCLMIGQPLLPWLTELLEDALAGPSRAALLATVPDLPYKVLLGTCTNLDDKEDSACSGCCPTCGGIIAILLTFWLLPYYAYACCLQPRQEITTSPLTGDPGSSQKFVL